MATTVVFQKLGTTATHVEVEGLDQTDLALRASNVSNDGLRSSADYVLASGDSTIDTTVAVRINKDPKAHGGIGKTNYSIRLNTILLETDDTSGETVMELPVTAVIAFDHPGMGIADPEEVKQLLMNLYGLTFPSVDGSFDPDTGHISQLGYSAPAVY